MSWPHATIYHEGLYGEAGPIVGVDVSVFLAGTSSLAVLYGDEDKTIPLRNPLPSDVAEDGYGLDVNGNLKFAVDAGDYRLVWTDDTGDHSFTFAVPNNESDVAAASSGQGSIGPAPWNAPVTYDPAATYSGATSVSPASAVNFEGSSYVAIVPSVTGVDPDSDPTKWALIAAGSDVETAIQQALSTQGELLAPWNAILGLAGSTVDPAQTSSSTTLALATGQLLWAALVLQTAAVTGINVLVTTAQVGTGSQVAVFDATGAQLRSMSGTAVDTWLGTIGSRDLTLTTPLTSANVSIGDVVYVAVSQPSSGITTAAQLRQAPGVTSAINAHQATGVRAGTAAGATVPSTIPFGSAAVAALAYFGVWA